jgi:hypothetical protein
LLPHDLDEAALQGLISRLRQVQGLRAAYLVRKCVTYLPEVPLYVLAFSATPVRFMGDAQRPAVMQQLQTQVEFPGETLIINIGSDNQQLRREFRAVVGARIL